MKTALDENELDSVAGGGDGADNGCDSTTKDADEEWCWFSDACNYVISFYEKIPAEQNYGYTTWDMCKNKEGDYWLEVDKCPAQYN